MNYGNEENQAFGILKIFISIDQPFKLDNTTLIRYQNQFDLDDMSCSAAKHQIRSTSKHASCIRCKVKFLDGPWFCRLNLLAYSCANVKWFHNTRIRERHPIWLNSGSFEVIANAVLFGLLNQTTQWMWLMQTTRYAEIQVDSQRCFHIGSSQLHKLCIFTWQNSRYAPRKCSFKQ